MIIDNYFINIERYIDHAEWLVSDEFMINYFQSLASLGMKLNTVSTILFAALCSWSTESFGNCGCCGFSISGGFSFSCKNLKIFYEHELDFVSMESVKVSK